MALTGLGAIGFLVVHLGGNLLVFAGAQSFNDYAHHLHAFKFLPALQAGLAILFVTHIGFGTWLAISNWQARPVAYALKKTAGASNIASSTMIYSGISLLGFLLVHLWTVIFGVRADMLPYDRVLQALTSTPSMTCYVLGILALGLHLYHGASSTFESLGLNHASYVRLILASGRIAAVVFTVGFISIPLLVIFGGMVK